jgi:phage-related tail protein
MRRGIAIYILAASLVGGAACADAPGIETSQRTISGGAIGAAGGAVLVALAGGSVVGGALLGGAAGAAIGALTTSQQVADADGNK